VPSVRRSCSRAWRLRWTRSAVRCSLASRLCCSLICCFRFMPDGAASTSIASPTGTSPCQQARSQTGLRSGKHHVANQSRQWLHSSTGLRSKHVCKVRSLQHWSPCWLTHLCRGSTCAIILLLFPAALTTTIPQLLRRPGTSLQHPLPLVQ
jgi:hypothetical protein